MVSVSVNMLVAIEAKRISEKEKTNIVNAAGKAMTQTNQRRVPLKDGGLRDSGTVTPQDYGAIAGWYVLYAAVQNAGKRSGAKPFSNYTTPGTGRDFMGFFISQFMSELGKIK